MKEHRIFQSMSRKATCLDNAAMESFFHIMKAEAFYQKETDTYETLVSQISVWIDDYNFSRRQITSLIRTSPESFNGSLLMMYF